MMGVDALQGQHILVIDDDERLRLLLRRFLEESGFRVTDVGSASDARQILDGFVFDLLIVDIMMPGETGLEFLSDIRSGDQVPALFLTAMSETEHRIAGLESGADDYMSKPFEPRELVLRIRSILSRAAAQRSASRCCPRCSRWPAPPHRSSWSSRRATPSSSAPRTRCWRGTAPRACGGAGPGDLERGGWPGPLMILESLVFAVSRNLLQNLGGGRRPRNFAKFG